MTYASDTTKLGPWMGLCVLVLAALLYCSVNGCKFLAGTPPETGQLATEAALLSKDFEDLGNMFPDHQEFMFQVSNGLADMAQVLGDGGDAKTNAEALVALLDQAQLYDIGEDGRLAVVAAKIALRRIIVYLPEPVEEP